MSIQAQCWERAIPVALKRMTRHFGEFTFALVVAPGDETVCWRFLAVYTLQILNRISGLGSRTVFRRF
jgi:hypothetical protein